MHEFLSFCGTHGVAGKPAGTVIAKRSLRRRVRNHSFPKRRYNAGIGNHFPGAPCQNAGGDPKCLTTRRALSTCTSARDTRIIREELLFEKFQKNTDNLYSFNNSSQIIIYFFFKKSGISFLDSLSSILLPNQASFHSFSFLSTESCDISA